MSKFWEAIIGTVINSVDSIAIKNNGGTPQIVITPKGAVLEVFDAAKKVIEENGKAKEESKQT